MLLDFNRVNEVIEILYKALEFPFEIGIVSRLDFASTLEMNAPPIYYLPVLKKVWHENPFDAGECSRYFNSSKAKPGNQMRQF